MVEIIGVKFNSAGKIYYFDPKGNQLEAETKVLVETARGVEMGKVVTANKMVEEREIVPPLKPIIRIATEADFQQAEENKEKEKEAFDIAVQKILEHDLDMKLVGAEYTFDRSKILFYFTADGRVDFRDLVKSLASVFRTRIELRQIGVRDEARQLGSIGICGRCLCCSTFLNDFHPVSIKMAKEQGLSLNPTKISGVCGRLMCCLQYEQNAYEDMLKKMPRRGEKVETPDGEGIVVDTATLKGRAKVKFVDDAGDFLKIESYVLSNTQPQGKGCKRRLEREEVKPKEDETFGNSWNGEYREQAEQTTSNDEKPQRKSRRRPDRKRTAEKEVTPKDKREDKKPAEPGVSGESGKDGENRTRRRSRPKRKPSGPRKSSGSNQTSGAPKPNSQTSGKASGGQGGNKAGGGQNTGGQSGNKAGGQSGSKAGGQSGGNQGGSQNGGGSQGGGISPGKGGYSGGYSS